MMFTPAVRFDDTPMRQPEAIYAGVAYFDRCVDGPLALLRDVLADIAPLWEDLTTEVYCSGGPSTTYDLSGEKRTGRGADKGRSHKAVALLGALDHHGITQPLDYICVDARSRGRRGRPREVLWAVEYHTPTSGGDLGDLDALLIARLYATRLLGSSMSAIMEPSRTLQFFRHFFRTADSTGLCFQGFVDPVESYLVAEGTCYTPIRTGQGTNWRYEVERADWLTLSPEERRARVRGPFWGTYLGPALAARADSDGSLVPRFLALPIGEADQTAVRMPGGGLFLTMSGSPWDAATVTFESPTVAAVHCGVWLRRELRSKGLL